MKDFLLGELDAHPDVVSAESICSCCTHAHTCHRPAALLICVAPEAGCVVSISITKRRTAAEEAEVMYETALCSHRTGGFPPASSER